MKALTVWQPWASLIALGVKPYEFRDWTPPIRLRGHWIAIHAGARPVRVFEVRDMLMDLGRNCLKPEARPYLERLVHAPKSAPLSHIVCKVRLGEPVRADRVVSEFGIAVNDSGREGTFNWAWPMLDVEPLTPPLPARGAQGLWEWTP